MESTRSLDRKVARTVHGRSLVSFYAEDALACRIFCHRDLGVSCGITNFIRTWVSLLLQTLQWLALTSASFCTLTS